MRHFLRTALLAGFALSLPVACASDFDGERRPPPPASLGDKIFSVLCDRVGASVLPEDTQASSYQALCHRDAEGNYADTVDESQLPDPRSPEARVARRLQVAKLHAMARRRVDLIRALNATFPDEEYSVDGQPVNLHSALDTMLERMVPLYESNPVDQSAEEALMPSMTRATGRLFAALGGPGKDPHTSFADPEIARAAQQALQNMSARQGYRPLRVALGAVRPALAYPGLRGLTQTLGPRMGPGGDMRPAFQTVLDAVQYEMETSEPAALPAPFQLIDAARLQPNRPRTNTEVARAIFLSEDPAFGAAGATPRYLVQRGPRGYAVPLGNQPGIPGTVSGSFVDGDNDGLADVDQLGRFVWTDSSSSAPTPFLVPGFEAVAERDQYNRAITSTGEPVYSYLNTSEALLASVIRDLEPLLDPEPANQHETVADLLSGAFMLYGPSTDKPAGWGGNYTSFDTTNSPLVDLLHATGQLLAHANSDVTLKMVKRLFVEHEDLVARLIGVGLRLKEVSDQHPEAALDPTDTIWDEMMQVIVRLSRNAPLFKDVLRALEHPDVQANLGSAFANYSRYNDKLTYDTNDINGPALNLTAGGTVDPQTPVDRTQPDVGDNRSDFHRIMQIIHDVNGVNACNRQGAKVRVSLGIDLAWPLIGSYDECELFVFENMGLVYLDAILGQAELVIRDSTLNGLVDLIGIFTNVDQLLEGSSGITGMDQTPSPEAFNRLVFFGAESGKFDPLFGGQMPDRDANFNTTNEATNAFVSALIDPVSSSVCPTRTVTIPGAGRQLELADCASSPQDLLRLRDHGTIFTWERFQFYDAMRPVLKAFDDHGEGEMFLELIEVLYRHWPSEAHGTECEKSGSWVKGASDYNPRYCAESGLSRYEPILAWAFDSDLIPALGELVRVLDTMQVHDDRNNVDRTGLDILQETTRVFLDPDYFAGPSGMKTRRGATTTTWADGTTQTPVTPFELFTHALADIDKTLEGNERKARWKRARSQLVDTFLSIDGDAASSSFRNRAVPKAVPVLLDVLRAQLNANCPDREAGTPCLWAKQDLAGKAAETIGDPVFSTTMHLVDQINQDEEARRELERFLRYLVQQASGNDALHSTLMSASDMLQILSDDVNMPHIYKAVAVAASPEANQITVQDPDGSQRTVPVPGAADRMLEFMQAITEEPAGENPYDPYRVLDQILINLVTPMDPADPTSLTPIEVFLDTSAEVNRIDASLPRDEPLTADDYAEAFGSVRDFLTSETRGMEQFYEIVRHRNGR